MLYLGRQNLKSCLLGSETLPLALSNKIRRFHTKMEMKVPSGKSSDIINRATYLTPLKVINCFNSDDFQ